MKYLTFNPKTGKTLRTDYRQTKLILGPHRNDYRCETINAVRKSTTNKRTSYAEDKHNTLEQEEYPEAEMLAELARILEMDCLKGVCPETISYAEMPKIKYGFRVSRTLGQKMNLLLSGWIGPHIRALVKTSGLEEYVSSVSRLKFIIGCCRYVDSHVSLSWTTNRLQETLKESVLLISQNDSYIQSLNRSYNSTVEKIFTKTCKEDVTLLSDFLYYFRYMESLCCDLNINWCGLNQISIDTNFADIPLLTKNLQRICDMLLQNNITNHLPQSDKIDIYGCYKLFLNEFFDTLFANHKFYDALIENCENSNWDFQKFYFEIVGKTGYNLRSLTGDIVRTLKEYCRFTFLASDVLRPRSIEYLFETMSGLLSISKKSLEFEFLDFAHYWNYVGETLVRHPIAHIKLHLLLLSKIVSRRCWSELAVFLLARLDEYFKRNVADLSKLEINNKYAVVVQGLLPEISYSGSHMLDKHIANVQNMKADDVLTTVVDGVTVCVSRFYLPPSYDVHIAKNRRVKIPENIQEGLKEILGWLKRPNKAFKLNNNYHLVEMEMNINGRSLQLKCSSFTASILLRFEEEESISYEKLKRLSGMHDFHFKNSIDKLESLRLLKLLNGQVHLNTEPGDDFPDQLVVI